ncbi:Mitochondrial outer membrane translocase complex [Diaporthe amygdali]|uniref:Mitochondrial outer membrane translocase complex n=1 Tax=Phomopsis amygdali TaxID=1214568 RepID=UPI0022FE766A|nr:Mitochondrial outer membrane translocase complex [Diaporthe amygdali]KAJ0114929.1 Mitochondrial outer membrane translocase complex [Diaporthe amygdali]
MFTLSEESKERIGKLIDVARVAIHYGYLPMVLYLASLDPLCTVCCPRSLKHEARRKFGWAEDLKVYHTETVAGVNRRSMRSSSARPMASARGGQSASSLRHGKWKALREADMTTPLETRRYQEFWQRSQGMLIGVSARCGSFDVFVSIAVKLKDETANTEVTKH